MASASLSVQILVLLAAYLIGSVSFGVVVSKLMGLADPHTYGSGNPGATNVLRTGNKKAALFTLRTSPSLCSLRSASASVNPLLRSEERR